MTLLAWLNDLFEITLELDGHLNGLSTHTISYQYVLETWPRNKIVYVEKRYAHSRRYIV